MKPEASAGGKTTPIAPPSDGSAIGPPAARPPTSEGFVFGTEFVVIPHRFDKTGAKQFSAFGLAAGLMLEAGYSPAERFVVFGRAMVAVGSRGAPATVIDSIGVAFSYRALHSLWIGGAFQGGRALLPGAFDPGRDEDRRFDSDYVFCPTLELSLVVFERSYGQWLLSVFPGYYFASPKDNDVFFVPIGFGLRTF